ncbi:FAD/NAD(P)-binding protein [Algibacter sp. Ld11]|uniref:FAD/NAD(P)-binding protein n=1 Tax=Algibacter sp. Ld11 TaxID=649150 RepID=UPI0038674018
MTNIRVLAIIGTGPRGGYALENLILELVKKNSLKNIHVLLFEETALFGNGQVYNTNQTKSNWININERILHLDKREAINIDEIKIPEFPSYHEWIDKDFNKITKEEADTYPPRAQVGEYLKQRFQTLAAPLLKAEIISLLEEQVTAVEITGKIVLKTNLNTYKNIDEVLLTIGHQPTFLSKQIKTWSAFASGESNISLFTSPYPIKQFLNTESITSQSSIGIRGFGLAMIDVARSIANKFGDFSIENNETRACIYKTDYAITNLFIPFSLDGLPPAPKPLNAEIDDWFKPSKKQISEFENIIKNTSIQKKANGPLFLIEAITPIIAKIYNELPNTYLPKLSIKDIETITKTWLLDQTYQHQVIVPQYQSANQSMQDFVGMATGKNAISLDYCIGQVWRHCQPSIYDKLSFNKCTDKVFAEIIKLDESTKRYSYGPPVESIQQMLALHKAGIMNLEFANNPDFELTKTGWKFSKKGYTITANIMIDSVLDSPKINMVNSPIIQNMLVNDLIEAVHDELGVHTDEYAYVVSKNLDKKPPIALLGRLAKGTIIGVDAILECFGSRAKKWASKATKHHVNWLEKH